MVSPLSDRKELGGSTPLMPKAVSSANESPFKTSEIKNWSVICDQMRSNIKEPDGKIVVVAQDGSTTVVGGDAVVSSTAKKPKKSKSKKKRAEETATESPMAEGGATGDEDEDMAAAQKKPVVTKRKKKKDSISPDACVVSERDDDQPSRDRSTSPHKPKPSVWGAKSVSPGQVPPPPHFLRPDQMPNGMVMPQGVPLPGALPPQSQLRQYSQPHQPMQPVALQPTSSGGFTPPSGDHHQQHHQQQHQHFSTHTHHRGHQYQHHGHHHNHHHHNNNGHHGHHHHHNNNGRFVKQSVYAPAQPTSSPSFQQPKFPVNELHIPFTEQGLSDEIYTFVGAAMLRKSEIQAREKTHQKVERCIVHHIASLNKELEESAAKVGAAFTPVSARLVLFGSYAVGLSTPNSDMDLTVVVTPFPPADPNDFVEGESPNGERRRRTNRNEILHFLETLSSALTDREKLKAGVIATSKVPVVSVYDSETSISCDISLNMGHMEKVVLLQRAWLSTEEQIDRRVGCGREIPAINDIGPEEQPLASSSAAAATSPTASTVFISRAKALIIMTKVALRQWGLCSSFTGGLSSTSVYLLVERFLREGRAPTAMDDKNTTQSDSLEKEGRTCSSDVHTRRNNTCTDDQLSIARLLLEFWRYLASDGHIHGYLVHDIFCVKPSEPYEQIPDDEPRVTTSPTPASEQLDIRQFSAGFSGGASMSSVATPNPETQSEGASEDRLGGVADDGATNRAVLTSSGSASGEGASKEFYWYGPGVTFVDPNCNTIIPLHLLPDVSRRCTRLAELRALMLTSAEGLSDAVAGGYRKSWSASTPVTNILVDPRLVTSPHGMMYVQQRNNGGEDKGGYTGRGGGGGRGGFQNKRGGRGGHRPVHPPHNEDIIQASGAHTPPTQSLGFKSRDFPPTHHDAFNDNRNTPHSANQSRQSSSGLRPIPQPRPRQVVPTTPPHQQIPPVFAGPYFNRGNFVNQVMPLPLEQMATPGTPPVLNSGRDESRNSDSGRLNMANLRKGGGSAPPSYFDSLQAGATSPFSNDAPCFNPTSRTGKAILSRTSSRNGSPIPSDDQDS